MTGYVVRRLFYMLPTLLLLSFLIFFIVRIQPGDPFSGCELSRPHAECEKLRDRYTRAPLIGRYDQWLWGVLTRSDPRPVKIDPGPNRVVDSQASGDDVINENDHTIDRGPNKKLDTTAAGDDEINIVSLWPGQYEKWVWGIVTRGDLGQTLLYEGQSVLWMLFGQNRLFYSLLLLIVTTLFTWLIAIPIGVYSATHRYTITDHTFTFLGFVGLAIPNFFFALMLLWVLVFTGVIGKVEICGRLAGVSAEVIHLYYHNAPWDKCKILTFLWYLWPAVLIIGTGNMAMLIRYMRGNLLDILGEPYIQTARAKGLRERIVTWKHALRNAINPLISILGFWIPSMFEGTLVAVAVLNWPIVERTFYQALEQQDQYTIMGALLFFGTVLMLGNLLADVLLAWADPRIRYE